MSAVVDFPVKPEARPISTQLWDMPASRTGLSRQRRRALPASPSWAFRPGAAKPGASRSAPAEQSPLLPAAGAGTHSLGAPQRISASPVRRLPPGPRRWPVSRRSCRRSAMPAGVWLGSTMAALGDGRSWYAQALETPAIDRDQPFAALNAAFFSDGFVLDVAPGVALERPIEIIHLASGASRRFAAHAQPRRARCREPGYG